MFLFIVSSRAHAASPFRLLTSESAANPPSTVILGLQELGVNIGSVLIDTNPVLDAARTPNLGAKVVFKGSETVSMTIGIRYLTFIGGDYVEQKVKAAEKTIDRFRIDFGGALAFAGATLKSEKANYHFNFQWADVAGSRAVGAMIATDVPLSENWGVMAEGGYDIANHQPRASLGIYRSGPTFGLRMGATYVKIDDPLFKYAGMIPVIDLYWLLGGA